MLKIFLIALGLFQTATCGNSKAGSAPAKPPAATTNVAASTPAPTVIENTTQPTEQTFSDCSIKRTQGLPKGIIIPQELCFDDKKPVDAKERSAAKVGNSPQSAVIEEMNLPFERLPVEVQNIVKLTVPDIDPSAVVFDLTIIPTPDERSKNKLVNSYSYASSSANKASGKDPNRHSWLFKRQNNLLKLEFAEIDTTK